MSLVLLDKPFPKRQICPVKKIVSLHGDAKKCYVSVKHFTYFLKEAGVVKKFTSQQCGFMFNPVA